MKLLSPFKSLIQGGVILTFKISAAGGENVQLDILPKGKDTATGVSLPPKALVGTPEEIDAHLEEYLQKYAVSVSRVADVVASADAELKTLEQAAATQAKKAVEEKNKAKANTPAKSGSTSGSSTPKNMKAGLLDEGDSDDEQPTTLMTTGMAEPPAAPAETSSSAPAAGTTGNDLSPDLFNV